MNANTSILTLLLALALPLAAQNPVPCSAPEAAQFDFWIGAWDLTWQGPQGGTPAGQTGHAVNVIEKTLGGCVIQENFEGATGFTGKSWSVYNAAAGEWRQTWVDNSGGYLLFTGSFADGRMELRTEPRERNGTTFVFRMVFENITDAGFDWNWQRSRDDGATWEDVWNIRYQRRPAGG